MGPEVEELDLNPVIALEPGQGCRIVDTRIRVDNTPKTKAVRHTTIGMAAETQH